MSAESTLWLFTFASTAMAATSFAIGYLLGRSTTRVRYILVDQTHPTDQTWWSRWWYGSPTGQASGSDLADQAPATTDSPS